MTGHPGSAPPADSTPPANSALPAGSAPSVDASSSSTAGMMPHRHPDPLTAPVDDAVAPAAAGIFAMLADATRVRIVLALRGGEMAVGALAEAVGKPVPAVSQHLAKLRLAAMVEPRQEGNRVYYRLINEHAARLVVDAMHQAEHAASSHPPHHATDRSAR